MWMFLVGGKAEEQAHFLSFYRDFMSKAWGVEEQPCPLTQCHVEVFHCVSWLRKPFLHEPPPTGRSSFHPWSLPCLTAVLRKETSKFKTCALPFNILESSDQCSCVCRLCWLQKHWLNSGLYLSAKMGDCLIFSFMLLSPAVYYVVVFFIQHNPTVGMSVVWFHGIVGHAFFNRLMFTVFSFICKYAQNHQVILYV